MQLLNHIVYCKELVLDIYVCMYLWYCCYIAITQLNIEFIVFQIYYVVLKSYKIYVGKIIKIKTTTTVQRPTFREFYFSFLFYVQNTLRHLLYYEN